MFILLIVIYSLFRKTTLYAVSSASVYLSDDSFDMKSPTAG